MLGLLFQYVIYLVLGVISYAELDALYMKKFFYLIELLAYTLIKDKKNNRI